MQFYPVVLFVYNILLKVYKFLWYSLHSLWSSISDFYLLIFSVHPKYSLIHSEINKTIWESSERSKPIRKVKQLNMSGTMSAHMLYKVVSMTALIAHSTDLLIDLFVKVLDSDIALCKPSSVALLNHFRTNTPRKGMDFLISQ